MDYAFRADHPAGILRTLCGPCMSSAMSTIHQVLLPLHEALPLLIQNSNVSILPANHQALAMILSGRSFLASWISSRSQAE